SFLDEVSNAVVLFDQVDGPVLVDVASVVTMSNNFFNQRWVNTWVDSTSVLFYCINFREVNFYSSVSFQRLFIARGYSVTNFYFFSRIFKYVSTYSTTYCEFYILSIFVYTCYITSESSFELSSSDSNFYSTVSCSM